MRFDDRLATVLRQPTSSALERAVRWRQLVELVARSGPSANPSLVTRAIAEIRAGREGVEEAVRAAAARAIAGQSVPVELVALFAEDLAAVSGPLLVGVQLDVSGWVKVMGSASAESRTLLEAVRPNVAATVADTISLRAVAMRERDDVDAVVVEELSTDTHESAPSEPEADLSEEGPSSPSVAAPAAGQTVLRPPIRLARTAPESKLFRWECGPSGQIDWVEGIARGAMIGRTIAVANAEDGVDSSVQQAFSARAPFRKATLRIAGDGEASGEWLISGAPSFEAHDGRFAGYRGVGVRGEAGSAADTEALARDGDSLRELVHELKTPLNAIIGFAEIIDGQYLGPAHRRYREKAATILQQAWTLLDAVEDLDLAAKLQSRRAESGPALPVGELIDDLIAQLQPRIARDVTLAASNGASTAGYALDERIGRRLVSRLLMAVAECAPDNSKVALATEGDGKLVRFRLPLPQPLRWLAEDELFDPALRLPSCGTLGPGFAFRLVRGLAVAAGGELDIRDGEIELRLPAHLRG